MITLKYTMTSLQLLNSLSQILTYRWHQSPKCTYSTCSDFNIIYPWIYFKCFCMLKGFQGIPGHPGPIGERGPSGTVGPTVRQKGQLVSINQSIFFCCCFVVNTVFILHRHWKYVSFIYKQWWKIFKHTQICSHLLRHVANTKGR